MNNTELIKIVENKVNYTGYGLSDNWLGYSERIKPFREQIGQKIIDIFLSFFFDKKIHIITSAVRARNGTEALEKKYMDIENHLISQKYIRISKKDDYSNGYSVAIIQPKFKVIRKCDMKLITNFSLLYFLDSNIEGHCFFIIEEAGIIAYPHDDTGYGFINFRDMYDKQLLSNFFNEVNKNIYFKSVVNKR